MAILVAVLVAVPRHYRLLPQGSEVVIGGVLIALLWIRVARYAIAVLAGVAACIVITILGRLLYEMATTPLHLDGAALLWTAIDIWLTNVALFTLIYWQLDRGGPTGRAGGWNGPADFHFPRGDSTEGISSDWQPSFVDYFYLAFTTSTAFSPSEIYPLSNRAKILHIVQSVISLLTVAALGARAINVIGK